MPREILPAFPKTGADLRQPADPGTRAEWEPEWNELRRGGMRGGEGFLDRPKARLGKLVAGKQRGSHAGGARRTDGEAGARALLAVGLNALGLVTADVMALSNGAPEKTALARWLPERTTV
jgi:hypothetical protein